MRGDFSQPTHPSEESRLTAGSHALWKASAITSAREDNFRVSTLNTYITNCVPVADDVPDRRIRLFMLQRAMSLPSLPSSIIKILCQPATIPLRILPSQPAHWFMHLTPAQASSWTNRHIRTVPCMRPASPDVCERLRLLAFLNAAWHICGLDLKCGITPWTIGHAGLNRATVSCVADLWTAG